MSAIDDILNNPNFVAGRSGGRSTGLTNAPAVNVGAGQKFIPVDPLKTESLAIEMDKKGYGLSDADFYKRFPELANWRGLNIQQAGMNLAGQQDPLTNNALDQAGLSNINFSGKDDYQEAHNLGQPILAKEQRDRNYFQRLLANNPMRSFGLNSQDIAHIALANTNGQNVFNQGVYGSKINTSIASAQQQGQTNAAILGGLGSVLGAGIRSASPYLSSGGYGTPQVIGTAGGEPVYQGGSAPSAGAY